MLYVVQYLYFLTNLSMPQVGMKLFEANQDSEYLTCYYIDNTKHILERGQGMDLKSQKRFLERGPFLVRRWAYYNNFYSWIIMDHKMGKI